MKRHIIRLSARWALAADNLQWIVKHYRLPEWRGVAYIASNKAVLMRVLREKGVNITPAAQDALDHLPATFRAWKRKQKPEQSERPGQYSRAYEVSEFDRLHATGGHQ